MPRAAWLAVGAVTAALSIPAVGPVAWTLLGAMGLLVFIGVRAAGRSAEAVIALAVTVGFLAIGMRVVLGGPTGTTGAMSLPDDRGPWIMQVEAVGSPRDGQQRATLVSGPGSVPAIRVAATLPGYPTIIPGDRVTVEGSMRPPPDSSYGAYLRRIEADGTLRAHTLTVEAPRDGGMSGVGRILEDWRRGAGNALAAVLPEPEAGLAAGILIGLRDLVDRDLAAAFTTAGVSHVVAISGWNIAIVAAAIGACAGRLGRRRRSVVTVLAIVAYVAFAGASASVVRAGLMAGVVLLARESGRAGQAATALGWTVAVLLFIDPGLVLDAGLQLSALATAGLIAWATPIGAGLDRLTRGRSPAWLIENLGVSLAAQAATLPLILAAFGRLSLVAPAVNLVVVPLVAPAMAAGLVALLAGTLVMAGAPVTVAAVLAAPAWVLLRVAVSIVDASASLPFASIALQAPLDVLSAVVSAGLIVGLHRRFKATRAPATADASWTKPPPIARSSTAPAGDGRSDDAAPTIRWTTGRWTRAAAVGLAVAVLVTGAVIAARPAGIARVTVLDVGQGDAILVEGSDGGRLLVDGGPDPTRLLVALDRRLPPWDRRIDAVVLSHPHEDHVAGLARLLERYRIQQVFEPGTRGPGPGYAAWLARLARPGAPERRGLIAGDRLRVDEIAMTVLWPAPGEASLEPPDGGTGINNVSIVLLGSVGRYRFLLAGDVEEGIDPRLLAAGLPRLDLLKVAHHGSRTATTQAFVDAVRPRIAIASAGAGNSYGHPTRQTLDRLRAAGAAIYRTDEDGSVRASFTAAGIEVRAEGATAIQDLPKPPKRSASNGRAPGPLAGSADRGRVGQAADRAIAFRCAIPVTALVPEREATADERADPTARRWPHDAAPGRAATVGYHPIDDGAPARGGRLPPALPRSSDLVRAARACGGGGRRLPLGPDGGGWDRARSSTRRVGGPAARRGQDPPGRRSGPDPPPRRRLGGLADPARPP